MKWNLICGMIGALPLFKVKSGNFKKVYRDSTQFLIKDIRVGTFANCLGLEKVSLPASTKEIARNAFLNCSKLEEFINLSGVEIINPKAFSGCKKLRTILSELNVEI